MACVAALSSSVAAATTTSTVGSSATRTSTASSASLALRRSLIHGNRVVLSSRRAESMRLNPLSIRAVSDGSSDSTAQIQEFVEDLKAKWEQTENKTTVGLYAGGAIIALWLSSTIVGAINSVPVLPKLMELVGLGYTGWFVYRYLLFKSSRKELVEDIEELKGKITGAAREAGRETGSE